jgi:hypothetical protein
VDDAPTQALPRVSIEEAIVLKCAEVKIAQEVAAFEKKGGRGPWDGLEDV